MLSLSDHNGDSCAHVHMIRCFVAAMQAGTRHNLTLPIILSTTGAYQPSPCLLACLPSLERKGLQATGLLYLHQDIR